MKNISFKYYLLFLILISLVSADIISKKWANSEMPGKTKVLIEHFLDLGFSENHGMIFGFMNGTMPEISQKILIGIRILILLGLTIYIWFNRKSSVLLLSALILFWCGATGNLIDPFIYGYVVDFIHIRLWTLFDWPFLFNLADVYVLIGVVLFLTSQRSQKIVK
jgi:signal peptidase II